MTATSFFTLIDYVRPCSLSEKALSALSNCFYLGGAKAKVLEGNTIRLENKELPLHITVLKVAFFIIFSPLTLPLFAINIALRFLHDFTVISSSLSDEEIMNSIPGNPHSTQFFQGFLPQLQLAAANPSEFLIVHKSSGEFAVEPKQRGIAAEISRLFQMINGTSYSLTSHIQKIHDLIDRNVNRKVFFDCIRLLSHRKALAEEFLAAIKVEKAILHIYSHVAPHNSQTFPIKEKQCIEAAACLRRISVTDLTELLNEDDIQPEVNEQRVCHLNLLPNELIQEGIASKLSKYDLYNFGLSCKRAALNTFNNAPYWIDITIKHKIPLNKAFTFQHAVKDYYERFLAVCAQPIELFYHPLYHPLNQVLSTGLCYDMIIEELRKPLFQADIGTNILLNALTKKEPEIDVLSTIAQIAVDNSWPLDEITRGNALLALTRLGALELAQAIGRQAQNSYRRISIIEALEIKRLDIVKAILSIEPIKILDRLISAEDDTYLQKLTSELQPKSKTFNEIEALEFLEKNQDLQPIMLQVPSQFRKTAPRTVTQITFNSVRFTFVNFTDKEIGCAMKGHNEKFPFLFSFNKILYNNFSFNANNYQVALYPENDKLIHLIGRDEGPNNRLEYFDWVSS